MTPQECVNVGGLFPGMDLIFGKNDLDTQIADLTDQVVRQVRASAMGQTLREYEHTLRSIGVDYETN